MSYKSIALLSLSLVLSSCTNPKDNSDCSQVNYSFIGDYEGKGADSEGNSFNFFAKVSHLGDNKYRLLILADLDKPNEPLHVMDGVLEKNKFIYTSDNGQYKGDGTLSKDGFEGYYKGPIDGTFTMRRMNRKGDLNQGRARIST